METQPTELIVVDGQPNYDPIPNTQLLYVTNTTGRVFKDIDNQNTYVLIAGRWFSAASTAGPWQYVPAASLPPDFAKIPDESPMENVKASVPGTLAGAGGRHRQQHPADGERPAHGADRQAHHVRRRAAVEADRGHDPPVRRQRLDADHHDRRRTRTTRARAASGSPRPR